MDAHESPALERVRQKPSRPRPSVLSVLRVEQAQEEAAAAHPERGCPLRVHTRRTEAGGEGAGGGESCRLVMRLIVPGTTPASTNLEDVKVLRRAVHATVRWHLVHARLVARQKHGTHVASRPFVQWHFNVRVFRRP